MTGAVARKSEPTAPAPMPEEIRQRIEAAKAKRSELLTQQRRLAIESVSSEPAEKAYHRCVADLASTEGDIARFEAALAGMEQRAVEKADADQTAERAALRDRVGAMLDRRVALARIFEEAIAEAVRALHGLVELSDKAFQAWPGQQPINGVALTNTEIVPLISSELFRQGHVVSPTGIPWNGQRGIPSLPAPKSPALDLINDPGRIKPLVAAIEEANAFGKAQMEGKP